MRFRARADHLWVMTTFLDSLLLVAYLAGSALLIAGAASRWVVRLPDCPWKAALVAAIVGGAMLGALAVAVWASQEGLRAAYLGRVPWPRWLAFPWLWLATLTPVWVLVRRALGVRRRLPCEVLKAERRIYAVSPSPDGSVLSKLAVRGGFLELEVSQAVLGLKGLPVAFSGLRVAHVSDVHAGSAAVRGIMAVAREHIGAFAPDLVVWTGDFVSDRHGIAQASELVSAVGATLGAYAVLGNHDFWAAPDELQTALERSGVGVLRNRGLRLRRGDATVWIAGVDDHWSRTEDLPAALRGRGPEEFCLLLAHNPDHVIEAARYGVNLQLSGHTHGGQVVPPFLGPIIVPSVHGHRFVHGFHKVGPTLLHVNRGVGARFPFRWGSAPEVTLLTLLSDSVQDGGSDC